MISEDYVTYETAKLLKEKGFDEATIGYYNTLCEIPERIKFFDSPIFIYGSDGLIGCIQAPTLQMTMKWLREVHGIDIEVRTHYLNYLKPNDIRYYSGKILKGSEDVIHTIYSKDTYEQVAEAGIRYCLENLI